MTNAELFHIAHNIARQTVANGQISYRDAFRAGLIRAWKLAKGETMDRTADDVAKILAAHGGNRWTKAGHDRVYFNDVNDLFGIEFTYYKTGNMSSAKLHGEFISNCKGRKLANTLAGAYVDLADNSVHFKWNGGGEFEYLRDEFRSMINEWLAA